MLEVTGEGGGERAGVERIEPGQPAEALHPADLADGRLVVFVGIADEGDAEDRHAARAQRLDREQAVVDRAEPGARDQHGRQRPAREQIGEQQVARHRHQHAAGTLDHQRAVDFGRREACGIDRHAVQLGRAVRRERLGQAIGLGQHVGDAQRGDAVGVGAVVEAGLDRLPVMRAQRRGERCGEDGLADAGVGAGDDDPGEGWAGEGGAGHARASSPVARPRQVATT